ncbi:MAG: coenzyme F420-0:L-glutamate ligase [Solirubrobacterales bacterium]|nr:MAG: coenzyme F420-0:L-glutamate ligase [Solirubrobacterales bacterium]
MRIEIRTLPGVPEIAAGDDLAALLVAALEPEGFSEGDVLVVSHKVISKAEGAVRALRGVVPGPDARRLAAAHDKDARVVQVVLEQTRALLRAQGGVLICETHHGLVCANAGVDASNAARDGDVVLLPRDPDASARTLRARIADLTATSPGVLIADSFGRAWRNGQCDVAIGCAGISPLDDWRGRNDARGRPLRATWIAVADELAGAADLARKKDSREPAVLIRGVARFVTDDDGEGATALRRPAAEDLFR